jgi:hypothetical protein
MKAAYMPMLMEALSNNMWHASDISPMLLLRA